MPVAKAARSTGYRDSYQMERDKQLEEAQRANGGQTVDMTPPPPPGSIAAATERVHNIIDRLRKCDAHAEQHFDRLLDPRERPAHANPGPDGPGNVAHLHHAILRAEHAVAELADLLERLGEL